MDASSCARGDNDSAAEAASGEETKLDGSNPPEAVGAADQELLTRAGKEEQVKAEAVAAVDRDKAEAVDDMVGSSNTGGAGEYCIELGWAELSCMYI